MKILVVSYYFRPDLSAGSFRMTPFVDALAELAPVGTGVDVITTLPHRYHTFSAEAPEHEHRGAVTITRIPLPNHRGGMLDQSRAFATFARRARQVAGRNYDLVFASSSRLMTAVLGAWLASRARAPLYLDLRDIFADTIREVLTGAASRLAAPCFSLLERWAVSRAAKVNLVSRGFAPYFASRYPLQQFSYFSNGIDAEFVTASAVPASLGGDRSRDRPLTVLYAGNIGEGQGLETIIPILAERMGRRVRFQIVGDGGRRTALERALLTRNVGNVELRPPVNRPELLELYRAADVLFLHLNDYDAFRKVLPSKIFEYAALGKPIWAGVAGYAAKFLEEEVVNAAVFEPSNASDAVRAFDRLDLVASSRLEFIGRYSRATISRALAADVLSVARAAD